MNRAILDTTLAGALVFVTSICWTQSWAQDQGRPPAPPAIVGMGLPEVPPEQVGMSKQKLDRIHDALKQHVADGNCLRGLLSTPFRETLGENKDVSKGITDVKFFETPGLRPDLRRSNHIGC